MTEYFYNRGTELDKQLIKKVDDMERLLEKDYRNFTKWYSKSIRMHREWIEGLRTELRRQDRRLDQAELRQKQMIVLLKSVLDCSVRLRQGRNGKLTLQELLSYFNLAIEQGLKEEEINEPADLLSELIKKGEKGLQN